MRNAIERIVFAALLLPALARPAHNAPTLPSTTLPPFATSITATTTTGPSTTTTPMRDVLNATCPNACHVCTCGAGTVDCSPSGSKVALTSVPCRIPPATQELLVAND